MKMNRIYIFYAVAILTLGLYNAWAYNQQKERWHFFDLLSHFLRGSEYEDLSDFTKNKRRFEEINYFFELEHSTQLKKINILLNMADQFPQQLYKSMSFNKLPVTKLDTLEKCWRRLNDHLEQLGVHSSLTSSHFNEVKLLFEQGTLVQQELEIFLLKRQIALSINPILEKIVNQSEQKFPHPRLGCLPILSLDQNCLHAGIPIKGTLRSAFYGRFTQNVKIRVDGKEQLIQDGIVPFTTVNSKEKDKKIPVTVTVTNPLTKEHKDYSKLFTLKTCK